MMTTTPTTSLGAHLERWSRVVAEAGLDGWLVADFRWNNPLLARLLSLHGGMLTRRSFLWLPAYGKGEPQVLVGRVDGFAISTLECRQGYYSSYEEMKTLLQDLLPQGGCVAMEYVPYGVIPALSRVDAGLVELVQSWGIEVVSSGPLVAMLEVWDERQRDLHRQAARAVDDARRLALQRCSELLGRGERVTEGLLAQVIVDHLNSQGIDPHGNPDVAVNAHAADPHYGVTDGVGAEIPADAVLLIDLWGRVRDAVDAPFADSTWVSYTGRTVPAEVQRAFELVRAARDTAVEAITTAQRVGQPLTGAAADHLARGVITAAGQGEYFFHRTGHSLGIDHIHGMGTNLDAIEFPDERVLLPWSGFTIEPGLYYPGRFGIRLEVSAMVTENDIEVTTETQRDLQVLGS